MRRAVLILLRAGSAVSLAWALLTLAATPPGERLVERPAAELSRMLERMVGATMTPAWLDAEIAAALAVEPRDWGRIETLMAEAEARGIALSPPVRADLDRAEAARGGLGETLSDCLIAREIPAETAALACRFGVELTVVGDLRSLTIAAGDRIAGREPDWTEIGLAAVGLAATGALVVTGGGSAAVKAGTAALKTARRARLMPPALAAHVGEVARRAVRPEALRGARFSREALAEAVDPAALRPLVAMAGDYGRAARRLLPGETADWVGAAGLRASADAVRLIRHVESAEDAARVARVAEAMGPRTLRTLAVVGRQRAFRATWRLARVATDGAALALAALAQLTVVGAAGLASLGSAAARRGARRVLLR
ncbi:MAG: hypothetical protein AAFW69_05195 [Pseudomonadota bacterium]